MEKFKIGKVELNGNKELSYYFEDPSTRAPHSWCGETVKIASIDIFAEFYVNAYSYCGTVNVAMSIEFVITDEKGRSIVRQSNLKKLKEAISNEQFGYCCGWSDGPTKVVIDSDKVGMLNPKLVSGSF